MRLYAFGMARRVEVDPRLRDVLPDAPEAEGRVFQMETHLLYEHEADRDAQREYARRARVRQGDVGVVLFIRAEYEAE
jgi:hypothetical protein